MDITLITVRCEGCGRTKILKAAGRSEDDADLLAAVPGDAVERECRKCGECTDHVVVAELD